MTAREEYQLVETINRLQTLLRILRDIRSLDQLTPAKRREIRVWADMVHRSAYALADIDLDPR